MDVQDLNTVLLRVRRALALNFQQPIWVRTELSQVNERKGHRYLELVQKGADQNPIAKAQASVWGRTFNQVVKTRGSSAADVLVAGQEVCLQVEVDFHEIYGLKLNVVDWDPAFTIGQLALKRIEIVKQLAATGELEKQRQLSLKPVLQRIAVLTSSAAAGYADFKEQLQSNPYGYRFGESLFDISVQGVHVEASLLEAMKQITANASWYDAVVILRGGGSKLDLAGFDRLEIGRAIANCPLPVLVGIGHEIDETLPDLVAFRSLKTPTALASALIDHNANFESRQLELAARVGRIAQQHITQEDHRLLITSNRFGQQCRTEVSRKSNQLALLEKGLFAQVSLRLEASKQVLSAQERQLEALDPKSVFARGFTLTTKQGKILTKADGLTVGDEINTYFGEKSINSKVI
ncbi:MAG: exodeoxyribonuclease VII large subunit [Saprospiraceae bacterium]